MPRERSDGDLDRNGEGGSIDWVYLIQVALFIYRELRSADWREQRKPCNNSWQRGEDKGKHGAKGHGAKENANERSWLEQRNSGRSTGHVGKLRDGHEGKGADQKEAAERQRTIPGNRIRPRGQGASQVTRTRVLRVARVCGCESCEE